MTTRARLLVATAVLAGISGISAAPALAEPEQVCVAHTNDRRGICLEFDVPPDLVAR